MLRRAVDSSSEDLARHAERMKETFTAQYADLAALTGADPRPPSFERSLPPIALPDIDLSTAFAPLRVAGQQLQSSARLKSRGGAVAGAVLGTHIFPGVGTVIGAAAGWVAGSVGRTKEKQKLRSGAEAMHAKSLEAARDAIRRSEPALCAVLNDAVRALVALYMASAGPVVAQLTADYHARVAQLDADLHRVLDVLSEARRRHGALVEHGLGSEA